MVGEAFRLPRDGKLVPYMQKGLTESVKPFTKTTVLDGISCYKS